jgi:subtilisin family serine protease
MLTFEKLKISTTPSSPTVTLPQLTLMDMDMVIPFSSFSFSHSSGTHVAGTIGGKTVGVARGVNIYSLKILSDDGEGDTSDIIDALELVHTKAFASGRRSIMSMSLGGDCDGDCSNDSLVMAVESLYEAGILSSVASGNSGCNVRTNHIPPPSHFLSKNERVVLGHQTRHHTL